MAAWTALCVVLGLLLKRNHRLVFGEGVADGDQDLEDFAAFDVFAQVGQLEFNRHAGSL